MDALQIMFFQLLIDGTQTCRLYSNELTQVAAAMVYVISSMHETLPEATILFLTNKH